MNFNLNIISWNRLSKSILMSCIFLLPGLAIAEPHLSSHLQQLQYDYVNYQGGGTFTSADATLNILESDRVMVTITSSAEEAPETIKQLEKLGMTHITHYKHLISGVLPIAQLSQLESVQGVHWASSQRATLNSIGLATNAGDQAMFTDVVKKQQGVDGSGIKIGVLSDSYNCLAGADADIASGDLPGNVLVVREYPFCEEGASDEGRAMMQLIHDIAPGARLLFHTAFESPVGFAQGIIDLADLGADIIVDDISWLLMPMVQEGPIAQAVNEVAQRGVVYFSAAGNNGRQSYQQAFRKVTTASGALAHDFGQAAGRASDIYQKITIPQGVEVRVVLQWDNPARIAGGAGATADLDLFVLDSAKNRVITSSQDHNIGHDPVEFVGIQAPEDEALEVNLFIRKSAGADPRYVKYVMFSTGTPEIINKPEPPEPSLLHLNNQGVLVLESGQQMPAGTAVIVVQDYSGEFSMTPGLVIIGLNGAPIVTNQSNGQHGVVIEGNYYPIDTLERPIWFIPEGYSATLNAQGKIELIDASVDEEVQTDVRISEYATRSSTLYGHANAAGAIAVGAMSYQQAPWFNGAGFIEKFSSAGGLPIVFDSAGGLLENLIFRAKPEIVAIDNIDTTFFPAVSEETDTDQSGLPNFSGTSAAAPNAAAVAALLLQKYAYLRPKEVRQIMMRGTIDLTDPALVHGEYALPYNPCASGVQFDWGSGCGLIQADLIFEVAATMPIPTSLGDFNQDGCVDYKDSGILLAILRSDTSVQAVYDLSGDGVITHRDFNALQQLYSTDCQ